MNSVPVPIVDFCVIGAQKAATTSIFQWLKEHPLLELPKGKEAPFFVRDELYEMGWDKYSREIFNNVNPGVLHGTVTPQYFGNKNSAERMSKLFPNCKLILVVRDPIERAYSHYKMEVRAGHEERSFNEACEQLLRADGIAAAREKRNREELIKCYISFGEYGYFIEWWLRFYPANQFLILSFDEVASNPEKTYVKVCEFLGVDSGEIPQSIGKVFHKGGIRTKLPQASKFKKYRIARFLRRMCPNDLYQRVAFWYKIWNVKEDGVGQNKIGESCRNKLIDHYRLDIKKFKELTGYKIDWPWL